MAAPLLRPEVLVVGGGPAGAACAYWLAAAGHETMLVERKHYPREKTCGDGLTPRSVRQLTEMGLSSELASSGHRYAGLRSHAFGRTLELAWPDHPRMPSLGYVITRKDLDAIVAARAGAAGALVWEGTEALEPIIEGQEVKGALLRRDGDKTLEARARYVVVADGANSRFGWAIGTRRDRSYPLGMALRGYWRSPLHDEPWIDSWLDVRDADGSVLPGYGWVFPLGDGRVNVGVGLLSTSRRWKDVNTTRLLERFVASAPAELGLTDGSCCGPPSGGRLPMGLSVGPLVGASHLVVGDAGGAINPFNGEGIAYAYETGRLAAETLHMALQSGDSSALSEYQRRLEQDYELYYRVGRLFVGAIGRPAVMRALVTTGMRSRTLMEWVLRIMANLLRPDELGAAEAAYRVAAAIAARVPSRSSPAVQGAAREHRY
jgi:geranylgeranyl reductase family protein